MDKTLNTLIRDLKDLIYSNSRDLNDLMLKKEELEVRKDIEDLPEDNYLNQQKQFLS